MRNFYITGLLCFFALLLSYVGNAQVSVTATSGTTSGSYATVKGAFDAINAGTHQGIIIITLTGNTTETAEAVLKKSGTGAASYTGVTLKPGTGINATISGSTLTTVLSILGSNVTIDGSNNGSTSQNLTISNVDTSRLGAIGIYSQGTTPISNVTLKNTIIKNAFVGIIVADTSTGQGRFTNIAIQNNNIQRTIYGLYTSGVPVSGNGNGVSISGNSLNATGTNANYTLGMFIRGVDGATVSGNSVGNFDATEDGNDIGIYIADSVRNSFIEKNKISNIGYSGTNGFGSYGLVVATNLASANVRVANNFISNIYGDGWNYMDANFYLDNPIGILLSSTNQTGVALYYNTIYLFGNTLNETNAISAGIYLDGGTATIVDNIIVNNLGRFNTLGYGTVGIFAFDVTQFATLNYNDYWVSPTGTGVKAIGQILTTASTTLAAWRTATSKEANGNNVQPAFVSTTDLHLATSGNTALQAGTPVAGITTDIDGDARSATTPYMGADEIASACTAPTITTQPTAVTVCAGASASFTVVASGTATLTYQWRKGGTNITGATSATYTIAATTAADAGNYDVVITNGCGNVTSTAVALTVNAVTAITTQPTNQSACTGSSASFTVVATGTNLTYQWRKGGVNIGGATSATYTIPSVTAGDAGTYDVIVTGACGNVTSTAVALTVNAATAITTQPTNQSACPGANATFTVVATGSGTVTYQWRKGGSAISGATSATLTLTNVTAADAGTYDVVITAACGSVTSTAVSLTVGGTPSITTQPTNQNGCSGSSVSFTVVASGTGLTYQWRKGGANIAGATNATYTIPSVAAADAGSYDVVITSACGTNVTSTTVTLTVGTAPAVPTISQSPTGAQCPGTPITLTATSTGCTSCTYSWNGSTPSNSNTTTVTTAGNYVLVVNNGCGSATATTTVAYAGGATITTQPQSRTVCAGTTASLSVVATGTGLTYQWRKGGVNITGATNATYNIINVATSNAGVYDVVISSGTCGSITSNPATLTVNTCTAIPTIDADVTETVLMPNAVQAATVLRVKANKATKIRWNVIDSKGRVVLHFNQTVQAGVNDLPLQLGYLASGVYQLDGATQKGKVSVLRLVRL